MSWADQPVGTWSLTQFVDPGTNGACHELGYFGSYRLAVEAARAIAPHSKLQGGFTSTYKRSDERKGAWVDGFVQPISLEAPKYNPHVEITLADGRTLWLEDLERELDDLKTHFIATEVAS